MAIQFVGGAYALGSSSNFSVSLTALAGGIGTAAQAGDLVIVLNACAGTGSRALGVTSTGYTEVADLYADDTSDTDLSVSYRVMPASPDTTVGVTASAGTAYGAIGIVHVYRGVHPTSPMDVTPTTATGTNSSIPDGPSITPATNGATVVVCGAGAYTSADTSVTAPTNYTNQTNNSTDPGTAIIAAIVSRANLGSGTAEDPAAWTG